jgi:hypothetical protein
MVEALFSINHKGELMSAAYYTIDDQFLKENVLDEMLITRIMKRSKNPKRFSWTFEHGELRVDILSRNSWRIEFFISRNEPIHLSPKNLLVSSDKVTFH